MKSNEAAWYLIALVYVIGIVFGAYHSCLNAGFLLDDYQHIGYIHRAFNGDPSGLLATLTGNWTGQTDGLTSFRPGISLSFCPDFLIWGVNPFGYHVTNLLVFAGCAYLVGLLTFEMCGSAEQRDKQLAALTAFAAAMLFVVYPIHAESVAWIIGRVDVHCSFYYLGGLLFYFISRRTASRGWFCASLMAFFCALTCKEMAVTLPVVIALAEILLAGPLGWSSLSRRSRAIGVVSFFVMLAVFAVVRTLLIGTVVGGYGTTSVKTFFRTLKNFLDAATFDKLIYGLNEELPFSQKYIDLAKWAWFAVLAGALASLAQSLNRLRVFAFLILWIAVAELPTFQIWHIYPNLVGSRLFFLGSAALSVLLALVVFAPNFSLNPKLKSRSRTLSLLRPLLIAIRAVAMVGYLALVFSWYQALKHNLIPWSEAGHQVETIKRQLIEASTSAPSGKQVIVLDLPQDYAGAGLIGRPEFLRAMLTPPLTDQDYTKGIVTLERPIPGSHEFTYTSLVNATAGDARIAKILRWDKDRKIYVDWERPAGAATYTLSSNDESPISVDNPAAPAIIWLKNRALDPLRNATFIVKVKSDLPLEKIAGKVRLVWRSTSQPRSWIDYSEGPFAELDGDKLRFTPHRLRSWAFNGDIKELGVQFYPGEYKAGIVEMRSEAASAIMPEVQLFLRGNSAPSVQDTIVPAIDTADGVALRYDASKVANAESATLYVTASGYAFFDLPSKVPPEPACLELTEKLPALSGEFSLPPAVLLNPGKHQVAIMAFDAGGNPVGYLSEPRTYLVRPIR